LRRSWRVGLLGSCDNEQYVHRRVGCIDNGQRLDCDADHGHDAGVHNGCWWRCHDDYYNLQFDVAADNHVELVFGLIIFELIIFGVVVQLIFGLNFRLIFGVVVRLIFGLVFEFHFTCNDDVLVE
jgi:hypothetical protein